MADSGVKEDIWWPEFCGNTTEYNAFWSWNLSVNTESPDISNCFGNTVLTWIPCSLLWITLPFYFTYLFKRTSLWSWTHCGILNGSKTVGGCLVVCLCLTLLLFGVRSEDSNAALVSAWGIKALTLLLATFYTRWQYIKGVYSSGVIFIFWMILLISEILPFRSYIVQYIQYGSFGDVKVFVVYCVYLGLVLFQFIACLFSDLSVIEGTPKYKYYSVYDFEKQPLLHKMEEDQDKKAKPTPELMAPFWIKSTFLWLTKDVFRGYRKTIDFDELYDLRPQDKCRALVPQYYKYYFGAEDDEPYFEGVDIDGPEGTGSSHPFEPKRSFFSSLMWTVGWRLLIGLVLHTCAIALRLAQPQVLGLIINFVDSGDELTWKGILYAIVLLVTCVLTTLLTHNFQHVAWSVGMQSRTIVNAVVYRKALRLSGAARKNTTVGEIVNLMSVDAQKIQDALVYAPFLWEVLTIVPACMYFMWNTVGPSSLSGFVVIFIFFPINGVLLVNKVRKLQSEQMMAKDQRLKNMSEVLSGIKILKLYAWEPSFVSKLLEYRRQELDALKTANVITAASNIGLYLCPYLMTLAIFGTFVMLSPYNILTADTAFVTRAYIGTLNIIISMLPMSVSFMGQGIVSLRRINKFLAMEELKEGYVEKRSYSMREAIRIENGSFTWDAEEGPVLRDINVAVPVGGLVAVVGNVGAGKTSLISSLLGEMTKLHGHVKIKGSVAYVPQQAWIQNATVRGNITFGKSHDERKYNNILDACSLQQDLKILEGGDMTEIGEKGINLSGGQKQRISLARACYQDEDIYLLDDPLSAVDAHVGKHIFDSVVGPKGVLKDKTRVLVTHGVTYLPQVDKIIVLTNGIISEMGSYEQLLSRDGAFADFLRNFLMDADDVLSAEESHDLRLRLSALSGTESEYDSSKGKLLRRRKRKFDKTTSGGESMKLSMKKQKSMKEEEKEKEARKLVELETSETGLVSWRVIWVFIRSAGMPAFVCLVFFQLAYTVIQIVTNLWLSLWTSDKPVNGTYMPPEQTHLRLGVFGALGVGQVVAIFFVMFSAAMGCVAASHRLHFRILTRIMHAPMSFFDTTPLGRIMNRFSKDLDSLDTNIPLFMRGWLFCTSLIMASLAIISYTTPIFLVIIAPLGVLFFFAQRVYNTYMGQMKRLDAVKRSPIYAHFDESVSGASSIRAYGRQEQFVETCDRLIDESQRPWYHIVIAQRWSGVVMETMGAFIVFFAALFAILERSSLSAGLVGLSITYGLQIITLLNSLIRCAAEMETHMVSVERIDEYCHVPSEAPWRIPGVRPDRSWPPCGAINFMDYSTRYRAGLDLVLKSVTFDIKSGEKVGVVGRTGAGKSSMALALFRLIEADSGSIIIDGIRLDTIGLHDVRNKISVIPQDPVVFSGTLRFNLDPFDQYADDELWTALEHAHLKAYVEPLEKGLEHDCGEGGEGLSVGQRQLVCLARALLRKAKILVLDEATAAVDMETDALIQNTIRRQFMNCTVITVAHRLNTIMDYDRIMVLDQGMLKEYDSPGKLLEDRTGIFYGLAKEAGLARTESISRPTEHMLKQLEAVTKSKD